MTYKLVLQKFQGKNPNWDIRAGLRLVSGQGLENIQISCGKGKGG